MQHARAVTARAGGSGREEEEESGQNEPAAADARSGLPLNAASSSDFFRSASSSAFYKGRRTCGGKVVSRANKGVSDSD
jgi:hypothetical protein